MNCKQRDPVVRDGIAVRGRVDADDDRDRPTHDQRRDRDHQRESNARPKQFPDIPFVTERLAKVTLDEVGEPLPEFDVHRDR